MVIMAVDHSSSLQFESKISEKRLAEDSVIANCIKACESPYEEHIPTAEGGICNEEIASSETLDKGYMNYGYPSSIVYLLWFVLPFLILCS